MFDFILQELKNIFAHIDISCACYSINLIQNSLTFSMRRQNSRGKGDVRSVERLESARDKSLFDI
jgi:hypothetical protein